MKQSTLSPLLLAGALFAGTAFAQDAAPPAAETEAAKAVEATPEAAAAPANEATDAAAAPAAEAAPATDAAPAAEAAPAADAAPAPATSISGSMSATVAAAVGAPTAGKARVVFFRPSKFTGGAVKFKVREGEAELGQLANGRWFVRDIEPGEHAFTVHSEAKDVTNVELEAGETYFFAGSISMGMMVGRPNLAPSDAAAFEAVMKKMKQI